MDILDTLRISLAGFIFGVTGGAIWNSLYWGKAASKRIK